MRKLLTVVAATAVLVVASVAAPQEAEARHGGRVAAAVIGGLAVGAIIGSAIASPRYGHRYYGEPAYDVRPVYYGRRYYREPTYYGRPVYHGRRYYREPAYFGRPAYYGPRCYWTRERFWNGYRWRSQRVRVCR